MLRGYLKYIPNLALYYALIWGKKKKRTLTVCQLISTIVVALRSDEKEFFES